MPADSGAVEAPLKTVAEQLDAIFAPWNRTDEPGMVVGIVKDGATIYRRGFGMASLETGAANTPATRMRIGSISKHFTALLALLLAEEGKLDVDAPIRAYIPELSGPGGEPTLRQLMQHRGGSRCYVDLSFIGHGMAVPPVGYGLKTQTRQGGRNFAPGAAMIYNNGGYHLVSIAIERAGRARFEDQLKARLYDVVGMPGTASIPTDYVITPGIATMHLPQDDGTWRRGLFASDELRGEGAMVSTVDDMLRWTAHLRARDRFGSPASWAALTEPPRYDDGSLGAYALGLLIGDYRGLRIVHHSGGVSGGTAQMLTFPDDGLDVVILCNGARAADVGRLSQQVADVVLADRLGPPTPTVPAEEFKAALGDYWSPQNRMIYSLIDDAGVLKLSLAKAAIGAAVTRTDDGRLVYPASGIGEISVKPLDGGLEVRFGLETTTHVKLERAEGDAEAFAAAAEGRYVSDDADTVATIVTEAEGLVLALTDGLGETRARLTPISPVVAYTRPRGAMAAFRSTISLDLEDGRATGFRLNTPRTRDLVFRRA